MYRGAQLGVGLVIATALAIVLISPVVTSLPTTAPSRHHVRSSTAVLAAVDLPFVTCAAAAHHGGIISEHILERLPRLPDSGSIVHVLTTLRC